MKVLVIGAGLGGLTCAIACRREGLDVLVLEKSSHLQEIGAGIQIPPNGARILRDLGLLPQVSEKGCVVEKLNFRRYSDGRVIRSMAFGAAVDREYGAPWVVIHRADYLKVLSEEAKRLGVNIRLGCTVERVNADKPSVRLVGGEEISGDVIVGADGLWSVTRNQILAPPRDPVQTGDMAYRATFSRKQLEVLNDDDIDQLCENCVTGWLGPKKHAVFYPVRRGDQFNLVLLVPDDMASGTHREEASLEEISTAFSSWDRSLQKIISCIPASVVKWKLSHLPELPSWTKGRVTLLGDACHGMLPYQAQGAAMAVEDAATLAKLLGLLNRSFSSLHRVFRPIASSRMAVPGILKLYERLRKPRATTIVQAAQRNQTTFHLPDGVWQMWRDFLLKGAGVTPETDSTILATLWWRRNLKAGGLECCEPAFAKWLAEGKIL